MAGAGSTAPLKFTYFPVFGRGPSIAFALEHSGLDWEGCFPENWSELKGKTHWRHLPLLEYGEGKSLGHEAAILNFIGHLKPEMAGTSADDFSASQQLLSGSEDLFKKLGQVQPTFYSGPKVSQEEYDALWSSSASQSAHNKEFGFHVLLQLLEEFHQACGAGPGKFTSTGKTVGECKLFTILHILKTVKEDAFAPFPNVGAFYETFAADPKTKDILETGGRMGGQFKPYFIAQPPPAQPSDEPKEGEAA